MTSWLKPVTQIWKISYAGKANKSWQTILYLLVEIKTFSRLSAKLLMFFPSRIDAAHARVIGYSIDG